MVCGFGGDPVPEQARVLSVTADRVRVVNVYVVNGREVGAPEYDLKLRWLDAFTTWLPTAYQAASLVVVFGDFNIAPDDRDVYDPGAWRGRNLCSEPERRRIRGLLNWGLTDLGRARDPGPGPFTFWDYRQGAFHCGWGLRIDLALATARSRPAAPRSPSAGTSASPPPARASPAATSRLSSSWHQMTDTTDTQMPGLRPAGGAAVPGGAAGAPAATAPRRVRRRDGAVVSFDPARLEAAITRAAAEAGRRDPALAVRVAAEVSAGLAARFGDRPPGVEDVQDAVEGALVAGELADVARGYAACRRRRAELRRARQQLGVIDDLKLGLGAVAVLAERYLLRDGRGRVTESTGQMMDRAAVCVAEAEEVWRPGSAARWAEEFAGAMRRLEFLPNSPTLMNAGTRLGFLSGCVVLPLEDSLASIFMALGQAAQLHQAGGGTGYSFSRLRPHGDVVASTGGAASGPASFLAVFNTAASVLAQGGRRRGASMAVLDVCHPGICEFIEVQAGRGAGVLQLVGRGD